MNTLQIRFIMKQVERLKIALKDLDVYLPTSKKNLKELEKDNKKIDYISKK